MLGMVEEGKFEEWMRRNRERDFKRNGKLRREGTKGHLIRRNLVIDKIDFNTRNKSKISLRDIREVIDDARKEFPIWYRIGERVYKYNELTDAQRKTAKIHGIDEPEAIKWFLKWIGSDQK